MKIPLAHDPFPPVVFSPDQERQLKWLSDTLLEEALAENDDFVVRNNRVLDKTKWRHVMRREDVSIYKRVGKGDLGGYTPDISLFEPTREPHTKHWRVPTCVGVGTMVGSLDDLLYGLLATTKTETEIRTTYIKDEAADARVLANVIVPTAADPLCSLLVRWSLIHQIVQHLGVTPRDVVNMESTGTRVLPSGERIGYIVLQSVDVPGCGELTHLGLIRSKFSSCFVFRDTGHGSLELFMRGFIEPGGSLGVSIAVYTSCMSLIAAWRLMISGQNKKLAYVARTNQLARSTSQPDLQHGKQVGEIVRSCTLCLRSNSRFRSLVKCDLCLVMVCSRCVDKRKLTHVKSSGTLVRVPTRICKSCLTTVSNMNAGDIAVNEHVPSCARDIRQNSADSRLYARPARARAASALNDASSTMRGQSDTLSSFTTTIGSQSQPRMSDTSSRSFDSDAVSVASGFSSNLSCVGAGVDITSMSDDDDGEWQSWLRLGQLRLSDEGDDTSMLTTAATDLARSA